MNDCDQDYLSMRLCGKFQSKPTLVFGQTHTHLTRFSKWILITSFAYQTIHLERSSFTSKPETGLQNTKLIGSSCYCLNLLHAFNICK